MPSQHLISPKIFAEFSRLLPPCWQRNRGNLRPAHVLYTIMVMTVTGTHGYRRVLDYLKRTVGEQLGWLKTPFPSSFSEARVKLTPNQCREAFHQVRLKSSLIKSTKPRSFAGHRLVAVDMTTIALPVSDAIFKEFQGPIDSKGKPSPAPQATLTTLWDVSSNTPLDWRLEKCYASERFAAYDMIQGLEPNDLLLADRGYPSRRMFLEIDNRSAKFLIRVPLGARGGFREIREFSLDQTRIDDEILLHEDRRRSGEPTLRIRVVKMSLTNGDVAVFATNLFDKEKYPYDFICGTYTHRWNLEVAFREMKVWHGLEQFHAKTPDGIHQEVAALMIFMVLTAEMEHQAKIVHAKEILVDEAEKGSDIRFNRKIIAESVMYIMIASAKGPAAIQEEYDRCMQEIWKFRQKIRPGRSFPRVAKSPNSKWKRTTFNTKG